MALTVLKNEHEHLDEDVIIYNIFQDILDFSIKQVKSFSVLTKFLSKTASLLVEFSFTCMFSADCPSWDRLIAKILFSRFPREVKGEFSSLIREFPPSLPSYEIQGRAVKCLPIKGSNSSHFTPNSEQGTVRDVQLRPRSNTTWKDSSFHVNSVFCMHFGSSTNLTPVLCITFGRNGEIVFANCLLDIGSG